MAELVEMVDQGLLVPRHPTGQPAMRRGTVPRRSPRGSVRITPFARTFLLKATEGDGHKGGSEPESVEDSLINRDDGFDGLTRAGAHG